MKKKKPFLKGDYVVYLLLNIVITTNISGTNNCAQITSNKPRWNVIKQIMISLFLQFLNYHDIYTLYNSQGCGQGVQGVARGRGRGQGVEGVARGPRGPGYSQRPRAYPGGPGCSQRPRARPGCWGCGQRSEVEARVSRVWPEVQGVQGVARWSRAEGAARVSRQRSWLQAEVRTEVDGAAEGGVILEAAVCRTGLLNIFPAGRRSVDVSRAGDSSFSRDLC